MNVQDLIKIHIWGLPVCHVNCAYVLHTCLQLTCYTYKFCTTCLSIYCKNVDNDSAGNFIWSLFMI